MTRSSREHDARAIRCERGGKVDGRATQRLMERFYENQWQKKMGKLESLREAQLWILARHPGMRSECAACFWAAFVLSGDWR